jgi:arylsulfatase A-like enzyme
MIPLCCLSPGCGSGGKETAKKKHNVILISLDTLRQDRLHCYGYGERTSENIDRLAEKGVLFENAFTTAPWTLPSHLSLFTSLNTTAHGVEVSKFSLPDTELTLAEILKGEGYRTGGFCAGGLVQAKYGFSQGFDVYDDVNPESTHTERYLSQIMPPALDWLEHNRGSPFFLFLHCYDVHYPLFPTGPEFLAAYAGDFDRLNREKFLEMVDRWNRGEAFDTGALNDMAFLVIKYYEDLLALKREGRINDFRNFRKGILKYMNAAWRDKSPDWDEDMALFRRLYDGAIIETDKKLGELFEYMTDRRLWENTLVIFISDHGEAFLEHGLLGHSKYLYDELVRIPLIMAFPDGSHRGTRIGQTVSIIDIMPTILDYLDIEAPPEKVMQGRSLLQVMAGGAPELPAFSSTRAGGKRYSIVWHDHKYIIHPKSGAEELYDLAADPAEKINLVDKRPDMTKKLSEKLEAAQAEDQKIRKKIKRSKVKIDGTLKKQLEALGYL